MDDPDEFLNFDPEPENLTDSDSSSIIFQHSHGLEMDQPPNPVEGTGPLSDNDKIACKDNILTVFFDICPNYLEKMCAEHGYRPNVVISAILDQQEKGDQYPRSAKRKREEEQRDKDEDEDEDEDENEVDPAAARAMRAKIEANGYSEQLVSDGYFDMAKTLLGQDFPYVPQLTLRNYILRNGRSLFKAYTALDTDLRNWDDAKPPWKPKKTPSRSSQLFTRETLPTLDLAMYPANDQAAFEEFRAARELRDFKDAKIAAVAQEKDNFARAQREGLTAECSICYEEGALNRMIQCSGETIHWFCRDCMKSQAETQVGMSKYELTCMSMDGCTAGFSHKQRALFLPRKLRTALDRIEAETVLRLAGIENLETCPFCPYAAEYPPVEVDKEFRCDGPQCQQVSCRLCRKETHIPMTCAEAFEDRGLDTRHELEEAMSKALIRTCNTCANPFIKSDGCNKITCSKCRTIQCDVCRQTVSDYSHFNDTNRGGKEGQCPLFDSSEERHQNEVRQAEEDTRKKVIEENPQVVRSTMFRL
ncbi:hypothetical protein F5Y15DRAFT_191612 [Xylariaceae sp. FL0016]|nr:hypothetical protein F5Y15DRAFT_191612 [Xylariaceae sp. FL0016]